MTDFDVIVIGGGPAGCYAALTAAAKGCTVAVLEEHGVIGRPRHDPGWLMESEFTDSVIDALDGRVPWSRVKEYRVCRAESGETIEKSTLGGYLVPRDIFDREIAALAVKAGVSLYVRTGVRKLVRSGGRVTEVETNSEAVPRVTARVIICADGIRSTAGGFASEEGLCQRSQAKPGISYLLANADVSGGVIEHFLSPDPALNYKCFFAHRDGESYFTADSYKGFLELQGREDNALSRKLKKAQTVEANGFGRALSGKYGKYFEKVVRNNIIFAGDASGGAGNIHGMIQGKFAGTVAAEAVRDNDVSEERLSRYQDMVSATLGEVPFSFFSAREDFGTFNEWFRRFAEITRGMKADELAGLI
ncbi:MAG: NAD(P)/FAD-dependent oxidoreductase [Dehalococcoidia bacterium]|nr:NAD(P)/FAD-dependent oxidoreductase [Dehalococcoidia bacterium]